MTTGEYKTEKVLCNSIRIFLSIELPTFVLRDVELKKNYFSAMDTIFALCDKYDIQIAACLNLPGIIHFIKTKSTHMGNSKLM